MIAVVLVVVAALSESPTPALSLNVQELPDIASWLEAWVTDDVGLELASFRLERCWTVPDRGLFVLADSGVVLAALSPDEARNWVLSPDSSFGVSFLPPVDGDGVPMLEPDSQVQLCDFRRGRLRIILQCGTLCRPAGEPTSTEAHRYASRREQRVVGR